MSESTKVIVSGNVEIQHRVHNANDEALRKECVGIVLEIIKTCAAAGTPCSHVENMLTRLDENADLIFKAIKK